MVPETALRASAGRCPRRVWMSSKRRAEPASSMLSAVRIPIDSMGGGACGIGQPKSQRSRIFPHPHPYQIQRSLNTPTAAAIPARMRPHSLRRRLAWRSLKRISAPPASIATKAVTGFIAIKPSPKLFRSSMRNTQPVSAIIPIATLIAPAKAGESCLMRALSCWFKLGRRVGQAGERHSKSSLVRAGAL